ncbi:MAG: competence/damage-inducible protein A [Williamsia herbipolensis]|uniref:competence/damage-inducible protein A n=1 Tax=uncultured Williamsia sp. TaxID=259311 RepID=UPI001A04BE74|nr:competence/damage-inducible protein A [uncultured Williamsia sp.]MBE7159657.1 competence/damage-inducible protein A [Williamsia herbipolensis]
MSARAGIVVTGTEVLTGQISDRNGPWIATQLLDLGVDVAHITVCGDRPDDLRSALRFLADEGVDLIVTSGGLGPTADDLTVATVADFCGIGVDHDQQVEDQIRDIVREWSIRRGNDPDRESVRAAIRKQAMVPRGATVVSPAGTAPGVVVPAGSDHPVVMVLPGPPRELQAMWPAAVDAQPAVEAIRGRIELETETIRMFGTAESELAETLRDAESTVSRFGDLEITTCLRVSELEMVTRFPADAMDAYRAVAGLVVERHGDTVYSTDGSTVDDQVAALLAGHRIATAESCTGGMIAARLTDRAGSSAYVMGGVVSYDNSAKTGLLDVPAAMIAEHGAVSEEVASAMATGALSRLGADIAVSTTGVAGPGGGTPEKPVGTVCFGLARSGGSVITRRLVLAGTRADVRERSVTVAMHMLRSALSD